MGEYHLSHILIRNYMMYYLMWRMLTGLREKVKISFLPVWYTKFIPNWCFGVMKQHFQCTKVRNLDDITNCVSLSSSINAPQLVVSLDGTTFATIGVNTLKNRPLRLH